VAGAAPSVSRGGSVTEENPLFFPLSSVLSPSPKLSSPKTLLTSNAVRVALLRFGA